MLQLTHDTEQLARKVAACVGLRPEQLIARRLSVKRRRSAFITVSPANSG